MTLYAGLDVGNKKTSVCIVDDQDFIVWRGTVDTHPEMIAQALSRVIEKIGKAVFGKVGLESGSLSPWLYWSLQKLGLPVICMDARACAHAVKDRLVKSDKADALALAQMLRAGWYRSVYVKSIESHRLKSLLGARDQLVRVKRQMNGQIRGLLKPFGIRLGAQRGHKRFDAAARAAVRNDDLLYCCINSLLEVLASVESQIAQLDAEVGKITSHNEVCWRLLSVPGVGPITALAFYATIEDIGRFGRMRDIGAYLGLTPKRYQSGDRDITLGISKQGDHMARHYLYEAANVLLSTVRSRSELKTWGLRILKRCGPKKARVAVARRLAVILGRMWKDQTHFEAMKAG
jgi:transposase